MPISVDIHPSSSSLCMINEPDSSTAYSLSGYVSVSLSSTSSFLDGGRPQRVLLRSLTLIFEGQAEIITNETGYSSVRLCRLTRELAPAQAMLLSNENENNNMPSIWNFVFDLVIPGWLPSSSVYGSGVGGETGTSYALYAEARIAPLEDSRLHSRGWSLSSLYSPFTSKTRSISALRKEIKIKRVMTPAITDEASSPSSSSSSPTFPNVHYSIRPRSDGLPDKPEGTRIPAEVVSKLELRATLPECVDMSKRSFLLTLRLRTNGLSAEQQRRLRLSHFRLNLSQDEEYTRRPFNSYLLSFPLPSSQPDEEPLLNPHPLKGLFDFGLTSLAFTDGLATRIRSSFSLLSEKQQQKHSLPNGGIALQQDLDSPTEQVWTRVDVCVPFEHSRVGDDVEWELLHSRLKALRPDESSPFLRVHHDLDVELMYTYESEDADGELCVDRMSFTMPVIFARLPAVKARESESLELPAYSQLFYSNGERRVDNTVPLPAYTPPENTDSQKSESGDKL